MVHSRRVSAELEWADLDTVVYRYGGLHAHARSIGEFVSAIRSKRPPICSGEDGYEAVRLVEASYESAREGRPIGVHTDRAVRSQPPA